MTIKPAIAETELSALVATVFDAPATQIQPIETGQIAKGFFFQVNEEEYVIRFTQSNMATGLYKDQYADTHFSSPQLPIPPVIRMGEYQEGSYAITRKMPGKVLDSFSEQEYERLIPAIIETLDQIHQVDLTNTTKFGPFYGDGVGTFDSWPAFLLTVGEEGDEGGFYGKWHHLFDDTFLDRGLFDAVYAEMKALLPFCPTERYLVHGDYGFDNVLAQDGKITAVLDWANAYFGDFLFDVVALDMWLPQWNFNGRFQQYYQANNRVTPNYNERLRCYTCYGSLDAFRFFAKTGQEKAYNFVRSHILNILEQS